MSGIHKISLPVVLFVYVLALSACATKSKEGVVAAPASTPVALAAEPLPAPVAEQATAAPSVMAQAPAPKLAVKKARKHRRLMKKTAKPVPPKAIEAAPVVVPELVVQQETPTVTPQPPTAPIAMSAPAQPMAEKGFLQSYWVWLLGIVIIVAAVFWLLMGQKKE